VLLTYLVMVVLFQSMMAPQAVLQRDRLLSGDVLDVVDPGAGHAQQPWIDAPRVGSADAVRRPSVAQLLTLYTLGLEQPDRAWLSMQSLIRDRLPPLEDLIVGGQPGPIGCSSAVAVVVGGLFLLYRGLIDYRIPLLIVLSAWVALLILPVPLVITEDGPDWVWLAMRQSAATWGVAVTFANYELLASPLLFASFFLATAPSIRPMARRWRVPYSICIGVTAAAMQLYVSTSTGALVAVLCGGLLTPLLDRVWRGSAARVQSGVSGSGSS
jgi:Na+-transporting NADH:ubiquinone oxidoreductase subunit NqrB